MSQYLDVLLADGQRLAERRAAPPVPPQPVSRADRIILDADRKRREYRTAHPDADTAMVYGAQIGHLHSMVRVLCNELDRYAIRRDDGLSYVEVTHPEVGETLTVGYSYTPGEPAQILGPVEGCHEGAPEELEIVEVWCNGADIVMLLSERAEEVIEQRVMERIEELARKGREEDGEGWL